MTRKSSKPACRVCGCTEHNACEEGCFWVRVEAHSKPLCSACSGTPRDVVEVCRRVRSVFRKFGIVIDTAGIANVVLGALLRRIEARIKADANNPDATWGGR
ncbi:hypothetical protein H8A95_15735 [Bradyrhizobium sp. Pear76]|uniref:hypothetical protein n=1 Tax=Bradyrhizobium oropedii TaxID=1571201 RepID=UPI001E6507CB|nr:hypothetical protein [Bradyrhizobium oropedii]MCC8963721.1 hypothetical protein [Bradyrhizobium oropedii]